MRIYKEKISSEIREWKGAILSPKPIAYTRIKRLQRKVNRMIPNRVQEIITRTVKETTRAVLNGAEYTTPKRDFTLALHNAEDAIRETIWFYSSSAAAQGVFTGLGGIVSSVADFPLWMSIKMKMLFEIAGHYGYDTRDFKERLFILHIFQLCFVSRDKRSKILKTMETWEEQDDQLPDNIHDFDWDRFQAEYRDNLDLIKIFQLIPGLGAIIGGCANHKLTYKLGKIAMNAYRMRIIRQEETSAHR